MVDPVPGACCRARSTCSPSAATRSGCSPTSWCGPRCCCWLGRAGAGPRDPAAGGAGWLSRPAAPAVYRRIVASRLRGQLAYRTSFALDLTAQAIGQTIELFVILVVFTQVSTLGGFTAGEVLLIFGLAACGFGLADLCVGQVERLPEYIRTGEFDVMLLRPLGTLPQLLSADVALKRVGRLGVGLAVYGWSLARLDLAWTPLRVLVAVTAPLVGAVDPGCAVGGGQRGVVLGGRRARGGQRGDLRLQLHHLLPDHACTGRGCAG